MFKAQLEKENNKAKLGSGQQPQPVLTTGASERVLFFNSQLTWSWKCRGQEGCISSPGFVLIL